MMNERIKELQAEQEPVAWANPHDLERLAIDMKVRACGCPLYTVPLYAAPVRTKDLTDDEIAQSFGAMRSFGIEGYLTATREQIILRVRSVLSAFKAKNDAFSHTKDLTVSEIQEAWNKETNLKITTREIDFARAVIAADREKNK